MTDPGEDIADALVAYVGALGTFSLAADDIRKTDNPLEDLKYEQDGLRVLFHASAEEAERIGRGGQVLERFIVSMLVVRKISDDVTKTMLATFTRELKAAIRGVRMATYPQTGEATPTKCDGQQMLQGQFCSVSEFTYSKAGTT